MLYYIALKSLYEKYLIHAYTWFHTHRQRGFQINNIERITFNSALQNFQLRNLKNICM
jgi:hypothetical protein